MSATRSFVLVLLPFLALTACGGGGGGGGGVRAGVPNLRLLGWEDDREVARGGLLETPFVSRDPGGLTAVTVLGDRDGNRQTTADQAVIGRGRANATGAPQSMLLDVTGLPEAEHTVFGVAQDGLRPPAVVTAKGKLRIESAGVAMGFGSAGPETNTRVASFDDGSFAVALSFREELTLGAGTPAEVTFRPLDLNDIALVRFSEDGELQWAAHVSGMGSTFPTAIAALPDGALLLAGGFERTANFAGVVSALSLGQLDGFVARYEENGDFSWVRTVTGPEDQRILDLAALDDGSSVLAGTFVNAAVFNIGFPNEIGVNGAGGQDVMIARVEPDGTVAWVTEGIGLDEDLAYSVDVFEDGSAVLAGTYTTSLMLGPRTASPVSLPSTSSVDPFVARLDPDGAIAWADRGRGIDRTSRSVFVAAGPDGSCVATGAYLDAPTWNVGRATETALPKAVALDVFAVRFDAVGDVLWASAFSGSGSDAARDVVSLRDGSWVVLGALRDELTFGSGTPEEVELKSEGGLDVFVTRLSESGAVAWATAAGGVASSDGTDLSARPDGALLLGGVFADVVRFDAGLTSEQSVAATGDDDAFVARINPDGRL